jgi:hypothetical protein
MPALLPFRHVLRVLALVSAFAVCTPPAQAIVSGTSSTLVMHMVRVAGPGGVLLCSGTAIDPHHVVTAAHCGPTSIDIRGRRIGILKRAQTATLGDGRVISVVGDALILTLREPLPPTVIPIDIGTQGTDGEFIIAGFGATKESARGRLGPLHQATVVVAQPFRLVAPDRMSEITASACFGDSGGAVLRNGALVGIITRTSHPNPALICGYLTHYTPITTAPFAAPPSPNGTTVSTAPRTPQRRVMYPRGATPR